MDKASKEKEIYHHMVFTSTGQTGISYFSSPKYNKTQSLSIFGPGVCEKCKKHHVNGDKIIIVLGTPKNNKNRDAVKIPVLFRGHVEHCPHSLRKAIINEAFND